MRLVTICCLLIFQSAVADYWQAKIMILNNQNQPLYLDKPTSNQVDVKYPQTVMPYQRGEIVLASDSNWFKQIFEKVSYQQTVHVDGGVIQLELHKRHPDQDLKKAYNPGYDCRYKSFGLANVQVDRIFQSEEICDMIVVF